MYKASLRSEGFAVIMNRDRRALFFGSDPSANTQSVLFPELRVPETGAFTEDELRYPRKRRIRLDDSEDTEFENTVNTRAMFMLNVTRIIGVPALLPPSSGGSCHPRACHRAPAARIEEQRGLSV
ncbi:BQ5605_C002g01379 [Microbotryum silenes-dioicae]|uniref:BQ5605_C002g01379 protein n=1 Tax=Microbotryum silenes-dioicae TaxID=796604 RepID=A0A2X0P1N3_9BASI|nr:BQ5605_C002g01379 [Microbotryum silenes-dioicae]